MGFQLVRFINLVLLISIIILTLTGMYGLYWTLNGWMFDVHRAVGWVFIAAIPWKTVVSLRSLRRGLQPNFDRGVMVMVSLVLAGVSLLVLFLGLAWAFRLAPAQLWLRQTAVSWHWMLGLCLLAPLALHAWRRWPRPRKTDFTSRRGALKLLGLGVAGLASWWAAESLAISTSLASAPRRFTGSRRDGLFSGNRFPVTHSTPVQEGEIDLSTWRLDLSGAVEAPQLLSYADLLALPASSKVATLDCTLGWYTTQTWSGISLTDLLVRVGASPRAFGVRLESVTGYAQILPMAEVGEVLLATHVGGEALDHWHGFPLRAVVPSRRGWHWVKWLARVEVVVLS